MKPQLVPELDVSDLDKSLTFYVDTIGFQVKYHRMEERFAFLEMDGISLMLQEAAGPGRRFRTAPLEKPYGRGVNFQIHVPDVESLYERLLAVRATVVIPIEKKWYQVAVNREVGNFQFVVADLDGYLLRFYTDLGTREVG